MDNEHHFKTLLSLTAEDRLLLLCAGKISTPSSIGELECLLEQPLKWDHVLQKSHWHRLSARLFHYLRDPRYSSRVPTLVLDQLQGIHRRNQARYLYSTAELNRILIALEARNIPVILLKALGHPRGQGGHPAKSQASATPTWHRKAHGSGNTSARCTP